MIARKNQEGKKSEGTGQH